MGDGRVLVRVRMPHPGRHTRVHVIVVPVVVTVAVGMVHGLVRMQMLVPSRQHHIQAYGHGDGGGDLEGSDWLAEKCPREENPQERRGGEYEL